MATNGPLPTQVGAPKQPVNYFGVLFGLLGVTFVLPAFLYGGVWWVCLWPAVTLWVVSAGYLFFGARVFGKAADGRRRGVLRILMFPYCTVTWIAWRMVRIARRHEPVCNKVAAGVYVGRRAYGQDIPPDVGVIVDLTAEFHEPCCTILGREYLSLPTLDAGLPDDNQAVYRLMDRLVHETQSIYIHCAEGHGRAAIVAALLLVARGHAGDAESALQQIREQRPAIRPRAWQLSRLQLWIHEFKGRPSRPSDEFNSEVMAVVSNTSDGPSSSAVSHS